MRYLSVLETERNITLVEHEISQDGCDVVRSIRHEDAFTGFRSYDLSNMFPDVIHIVNAVDPHEFVWIGLYFVGQLVTKGTDRKW